MGHYFETALLFLPHSACYQTDLWESLEHGDGPDRQPPQEDIK